MLTLRRRPASDEYGRLRAEATDLAKEWLQLMKQQRPDADEVAASRLRLDEHQRALDRWRDARDRAAKA